MLATRAYVFGKGYLCYTRRSVMMKKNKKLLIVSGFISYKRQHTGGVGMHVHRLMKHVIEPCVQNYNICDYKSESIFSQIMKIVSADVIHSHVSNPYARAIQSLFTKLLGKTLLLTIHGDIGRFSGLKNKADSFAVRMADIPILINKESYEKVRIMNKKAIYIPAFLPPVENEEVIPDELVLKILKIKELGNPLFVTNASARAYTEKGVEIYGIEFLIDYFALHHEYNLIVMDPKGDYEAIHKGHLPSNIHFIVGSYSFCGVISFADAVIRNTCTDGDSFSVKEALWYHKKVLATDAVSRPEGTFLFKYNDGYSLGLAIKNALMSEVQFPSKDENAIEQYRQLYHKIGVC